MTSRLAVSTSSTSTAARRPVSSSSTGANPTARAQRPSGDDVPDSSTMTLDRCPSSRIRMIAASAPRAAQAATGSPGRGSPSARATSTASTASESSARRSVARTRSGMSLGAELDDGPAAGADPGDDGLGPAERRQRERRRVVLVLGRAAPRGPRCRRRSAPTGRRGRDGGPRRAAARRHRARRAGAGPRRGRRGRTAARARRRPRRGPAPGRCRRPRRGPGGRGAGRAARSATPWPTR